MTRYADHSRRFEEVAARRRTTPGAEVIPFQGPLRELEQEPTMREIEVLQLISDGLWLKALNRYPHSVEIPLMRDVLVSVDNAECVGFTRLCRHERWPLGQRLKRVAYAPGYSSGRGLTATGGYTPFG